LEGLPLSDQSAYESIWTHLSTVAFRQGWIDAGGIKTRYVQAGPPDAPALVMLHGTGGTWEAYCATIGPHSRYFNCFALDFLGSGYSEKPDHDYQITDYVEHVRNFMQAVGVAKTSFIGISLGSWVTAQFALTHPSMVEKITLNAPFGFADDEEEIGGILARRGRAYDDPSWENIRKIFDSLIYSERKRIDDLVALRQSTYRLPEAKAASNHVLAIFGAPYLRSNLIGASEWRKIEAPALVVASLKDRPLYLNTARKVSELMPRGRLLEMDGVGHWPQFENPEEFNAANIAFLREPTH
jgi:2-hydroxy-6-oxonona-2,4-dienedioate hydrolase